MSAPPSSRMPSFIARVMVVDDEQNLAELIQSYLEAEGFAVSLAFDGVAALEMAQIEQPDVVVLDVMLPGVDGIEACRRLRQFSDAYVLMLTARAEEVDKIVGLSVGADDYLTKPFSPRELVARVKAMLRRPRRPGLPPAEVEVPPLVFGELVIDSGHHEVLKGGMQVHLTLREFDLLATLAEHPGRVFTRNQLLERIWGGAYYDDHLVDAHVTNLRKKLEDDPSCPCFIETVRGVGYRFLSHATRPLADHDA
jgi:two-component system alkaline phosphatase synthesis response regulator PhoP